jgi:hypothetical protein
VGTVDTLSKIFTDGTKADSLPQHKIFCSLETHVEYLDNIREAIDLHDRMMVRKTPFWRHLYSILKAINLPSQARDKHRKS